MTKERALSYIVRIANRRRTPITQTMGDPSSLPVWGLPPGCPFFSLVLKHGGPSTVVSIALLIIRTDLNGALGELRAEMTKGDQAIRAEMAF